MSEDVKVICSETNLEAVQRWATENNLDVIFPAADELFLDIDDYSSARAYEENKDVVEKSHGILGVKVTSSRSGNGRKHYVVTLESIITSPLERIALQATLGSDRRREANSLRRWREGEQTPTLFFEKKA